MSHPALARRRGQPYALPLGSSARPEDALARLDPGDQPAALWGDWFDGGVLLLRHPLREVAVPSAPSAFGYLDDQPQLDPGPAGAGLVGGGWLAVLGYTDGHSSLAFYDSLLRWRPGHGWTYESLGLAGREEADRTALAGWRTLLAGAARPVRAPEPVTFSTAGPAGPAQDAHLAAVEAAIGRIHRGDFYQVNLCTRLHGAGVGPPPALFARLAAELRPAYGALVSLGGASVGGVSVGGVSAGGVSVGGVSAGGGSVRPRSSVLASLSPELFLRVRGATVTTSPIKGTAPRRPGVDTSPALRASAKDAAENIMIVDLMRNDLSRVCRPGTVTVSDLLDVQPHPGVWHLVSTVRGDLRPGVGAADLLAATFPPGSVTGAPKSAAVRAIAELEPAARGAYTGSIGLVSPLAGADFSVLIRTFEVAGDHAELGVGGGLTADSVPIREWYECLHKAEPLIRAAGGRLDPDLGVETGADPALAQVGVFESILVSAGRVVRLDRHLARLDTSCRELYGRGLSAELADAVRSAVARAAPGSRAAVRVTARPGAGAGPLATTIGVRTLGPRLEVCRLRHQPRDDLSWRHKWRDRTWSEEAEAATAPELPYFTAAGRPDRLSETTRGNLFLLGADGVWCTPPLDESVLPGVTRREVLDQFDARDQPVRIACCSVADLHRARGAFWTSSLSGAVAVTAVDGHPLPVDHQALAQLNAALGHLQGPDAAGP